MPSLLLLCYWHWYSCSNEIWYKTKYMNLKYKTSPKQQSIIELTVCVIAKKGAHNSQYLWQ